MYYIGVDLGGTNIATGIMDEDGTLLYKTSTKTLGERAPQEITKDIAKTIDIVIKETNVELSQIVGIGIGVPGCMDNKNGKVVYTNNMNFSDFYLVDELKKYIDKPVFMANDANCAALGETVSGAAKGKSDVIMITIGTGVGGGFVCGGKVYGGFNDAAMEVGHISIDFNGKECNCGRRGCYEKYASANALIDLTKEYLEKYPNTIMHQAVKEAGDVNGRTSFDAARKGDEVALKVVEEFTLYLSVGIADLINIFQPEMVIVGGGVSNEGDFLLDRVREFISKNTYAYGMIPNTKIEKATLGNDAGIIGAGFLAKCE